MKTLRLSWLSKRITANVSRTSFLSSVVMKITAVHPSQDIVFQELLAGEREPTIAHN